MMGRREGKQGQFFYSFDLDRVVPSDHLVRQIDGVLDLGWVHKELAAYYSHTGRPSIHPTLLPSRPSTARRWSARPAPLHDGQLVRQEDRSNIPRKGAMPAHRHHQGRWP
jgi:hypothetical protein